MPNDHGGKDLACGLIFSSIKLFSRSERNGLGLLIGYGAAIRPDPRAADVDDVREMFLRSFESRYW
jgi:hypothetical protein